MFLDNPEPKKATPRTGIHFKNTNMKKEKNITRKFINSINFLPNPDLEPRLEWSEFYWKFDMDSFLFSYFWCQVSPYWPRSLDSDSEFSWSGSKGTSDKKLENKYESTLKFAWKFTYDFSWSIANLAQSHGSGFGRILLSNHPLDFDR